MFVIIEKALKCPLDEEVAIDILHDARKKRAGNQALVFNPALIDSDTVDRLIRESRFDYQNPEIAIQAFLTANERMTFRCFDTLAEANSHFKVTDVDYSPAIIQVNDDNCSVKLHDESTGLSWVTLRSAEHFMLVKGSPHFEIWTECEEIALETRKSMGSRDISTASSGTNSTSISPVPD